MFGGRSVASSTGCCDGPSLQGVERRRPERYAAFCTERGEVLSGVAVTDAASVLGEGHLACPSDTVLDTPMSVPPAQQYFRHCGLRPVQA